LFMSFILRVSLKEVSTHLLLLLFPIKQV